ncbi:Clavaminate synthase-like protein [Acephala macrosclerotiorum]|nr:Clavaminate synthase-like protein [Acephala macrosclerotiorum]
MATSNFPLLSFQEFLTGTEVEKRAVAQKLYNAFHTYGWVYLQDFGISKKEIAEMFAMSKKYFERPLDAKLKETLNDAETNQGYTPDGAEANGGTDHKECYEHRRFKNDLCPSDEEFKDFKTFIDGFYEKCFNLSVNVLQALALVMDLDMNYFSSALAKADPQLRLLHYMPIERSIIETAGHARIIPHTDFGLCTLLFQDNIGGLEVDPFHTGEFVPATPIEGTCVINVADLLQRLSNDRLRSTLHRVTSPPSEKVGVNGMLPARYSTAFFVHPSADVEIDPILRDGEAKKYESVNAGKWRTMNTARNYANILGPDSVKT